MCAIISCLAIAVFSCKKSSDSSSKSKTELVAQSSWKLQTVGLDADKNGSVDLDLTSNIQSCDLDDTYTFKSDGTGVADEGGSKCNTSDPQTTSFSWAFKNNETVMSGNLSGFLNGDANISTLNDTNFVLWKDSTYMSAPVRIYLTLKH